MFNWSFQIIVFPVPFISNYILTSKDIGGTSSLVAVDQAVCTEHPPASESCRVCDMTHQH
jgi:hypothetical protein